MQIALLQVSQYDAMIDLLAELHAHYQQSANSAQTTTRQALADHFYNKLLAPESPLQLVVASAQDGQLLGFAGFFIQHALIDPDPSTSAQCQLKELFVSQHARHSGVGKALMHWLAHYALKQSCTRIDWPVHAENASALAFYQSLGAEPQPHRLNYRLTSDAMKALVKP